MMRRIARAARFALLVGMMFAAIGCALPDEGGIGGTGATDVSRGPIEGFGSIFVNGVEWEIDLAEVELDDERGSGEELQLGMVVTVA